MVEIEYYVDFFDKCYVWFNEVKDVVFIFLVKGV